MRYRTQSVAYWYFAVAMLLFGLQLVFGLLSVQGAWAGVILETAFPDEAIREAGTFADKALKKARNLTIGE